MAIDLFPSGGGGIKSVLRGTTNLGTAFGAATVDVTISAVDAAKSAVLVSTRTSWNTSSSGELAIGATAYLVNSTTLRVQRGGSTVVNATVVEWQVVEFN